MVSFTTVVSVVAVALLPLAVDSWSSGGQNSSPNHNYDLSGPDLRRLLSSPVYLAERMKRPLDGSSTRFGPISHSGVRVTLADGSRWLVHKGDGYGISSQTVVTAERHMSPLWETVATRDFQGSKTVSDLVREGGPDYNLLFDNCHLGSRRMMN